MCDIFPEVDNCCFSVSLRIAMLIISILAIITGAITLSLVEETSNTNFDTIKNISTIRDVDQAMSKLGSIIPSGLTAMAVIFMFTGVVLLFATLTDQEGFVQVFVWVTFANVLFGFVCAFAIMGECIFKDVCLLSDLDWLTGAVVLVAMVAYMIVWLYFIVVANSYVLQVLPH